MSRRRGVTALLLILTCASSASAQFRRQLDAPTAGSWEIGGGGFWGSSVDFGERRAQQTRNPTTGSEPLDLFVTDSSLEPAAGAQAYLAYYIVPAIAIEAGLRWSQPRLRVRVTSDFEDADPTTAEERLTQYQFDGSLVVHLTNLRFADESAVPFLIGGVGHIRELHQGEELVETGTAFHGGGGLKWWFGSGRERFGLRIEARVTSRSGGFDFDEERRTEPSAGVSLSYLF